MEWTRKVRTSDKKWADEGGVGGGGEDEEEVESDCPDASFADLASPSSASYTSDLVSVCWLEVNVDSALTIAVKSPTSGLEADPPPDTMSVKSLGRAVVAAAVTALIAVPPGCVCLDVPSFLAIISMLKLAVNTAASVASPLLNSGLGTPPPFFGL